MKTNLLAVTLALLAATALTSAANASLTQEDIEKLKEATRNNRAAE